MAVRFVSALLHAAKNIETAIFTCPIDDGDDGDDVADGDDGGRLLEAGVTANEEMRCRNFMVLVKPR